MAATRCCSLAEDCSPRVKCCSTGRASSWPGCATRACSFLRAAVKRTRVARGVFSKHAFERALRARTDFAPRGLPQAPENKDMTHNRNKTALVIALTALGFTAGALAQGTTGTSSQPAATSKSQQSGSKSASGSLASDDRKFVEKAAMDGMAEVELGRMAASKATDPQ